MIPGREEVGEQGEVVLVLLAHRQRNAVEVRERHAQVFDLPARVRPHPDVAVGAARTRCVHRQAERGLARSAVVAVTTSDVERQDHAIALAARGDARPDFFDDPHVPVTEDDPELGVRAALVPVQVRSADRGRRDAHQSIGGCLMVGSATSSTESSYGSWYTTALMITLLNTIRTGDSPSEARRNVTFGTRIAPRTASSCHHADTHLAQPPRSAFPGMQEALA